jgi:hypothetical protein
MSLRADMDEMEKRKKFLPSMGIECRLFGCQARSFVTILSYIVIIFLNNINRSVVPMETLCFL